MQRGFTMPQDWERVSGSEPVLTFDAVPGNCNQLGLSPAGFKVFDLFWNNRYKRDLSNLFYSNHKEGLQEKNIVQLRQNK